MILLSFLLALAAGALLLRSVSDLWSLLRARHSRSDALPPGPLPRLLFLVPAHDEELLIEPCLRSLLSQDYPIDRRAVVLIADNCRDGTAAIARGLGVHCLERHEPARPGKPHALAWALDRLPFEDVDAVVIVDADTVVAPDFAAALAESAPLADKVLQPFNGVANPADNALTRMAAVLSTANHRFAFGLKNRAALNVPLSTGMCLGAAVLATTGWTAFSICEDWEMYALLTERGIRIASVPAARIFAQETTSLRQSASQRRRWTAGRLTVLARYASGLLRSRRISVAQKLDCLAELSAPGPAAHLGAATVLSFAAVALQPPGAVWITVALAASVVRWGVYTVAALAIDPQPRRTLVAFAFLPLYAVWRAGAALAALVMLGDQRWIRTRRHPGSQTG